MDMRRVIRIMMLLFSAIMLFATNVFADDGDYAPVSVKVDNQNIYDGMDKAYCDGYIPQVENGYAYIVLPVICDGGIKDNTVTAKLDLGDTQSMPFVCKNYEKNVYLTEMEVNNHTGKVSCYPVVFSLELKSDRINGNYPVTFSIKGQDNSGNEVSADFVVYVNITDGQNLQDTADTSQTEPVFTPKLIIESYTFSTDTINAGDAVTININLHNTSGTEMIKNASVTVEEPESNFSPADKSSGVFIGDIAPDGNAVVSMTYNVSAVTPQGEYDFNVTADYADIRGNTCTGGGKVRMNVVQPVNVQFNKFSLGESFEVADVANATVQVMNLGREKIYNVRAEIEGDGLSPEKTIFIGDVEAGQQAEQSAYVTITGLKDSTYSYGDTTGKITYYYEDQAGKQYQSEDEFTLRIESPFAGLDKESKTVDKTGQWWIIMAVIVVILLIIAAFVGVRHMKRRQDINETNP